MFENTRKGRQARNFTRNAPKIVDLKSSSEQIFSRKLPLGAPEMLISVQKYELQYGKISPILSTQITAPVKKISISQYKNISSGTNIFIGCATRFFGTVKFMYTTVQQYLSQYKNINLSTKIKVAVQKMKRKMERKI